MLQNFPMAMIPAGYIPSFIETKTVAKSTRNPPQYRQHATSEKLCCYSEFLSDNFPAVARPYIYSLSASCHTVTGNIAQFRGTVPLRKALREMGIANGTTLSSLAT